MKKILTMMLVAAVVLSLAVTAAAAITPNGDASGDVKANYVADQTKTVYSVDIAWGSMEFTYDAGSKGTWVAGEHKYQEGTAVEAGWKFNEGANVITVTNHSNIGIQATAEFTKNAELAAALSNVSVTLSDGGVLNLVSAETNGKAEIGTLSVQVSGEVAEAFTNSTVLGTIHVTIE